MSPAARRRYAAAALAVLLAAVLVFAVVRALGGAGGDAKIAGDAARLVPPDAFVYVHLSTDSDRDGTQRALELVRRFDAWPRLRDGILRRLSVRGEARDIEPWLGDEVALALTSGTGETAGSLILLDVDDRVKAQAFVDRAGANTGPASEHRGVRIQRYGSVVAAFVGDTLALGQPETVRAAIDLDKDRRPSLATAPQYRQALDGLPEDRVADAYATADGLRRLLIPAGGVLGTAGVLLDRPGLQATAVALREGEPGARLQVHSLASPPANSQAFRPFTPELPGEVPKSALGYVGVKGIDRAGGRLFQAAGTTALAGLATAARQALGGAQAAQAQRELLATLRNEAAVVVLPGIPAPTVGLIARAADEAATRAALQRLARVAPRALRGAKVGTQTIAGERATVLRTGSGLRLVAAVFDGKLVVGTGPEAIARAKDPDGGLAGTDAFGEVVGGLGSDVSSVVFLDFSQLLKLGEQTGLNDSRAYLAVKSDLNRVRAVGARSSGREGDTTAEILLSIP